MNKSDAILAMIIDCKKVAGTDWEDGIYLYFNGISFINAGDREVNINIFTPYSWKIYQSAKVKMWQWVVEYEDGLTDLTVFGVDEKDALKKDKEHWSIPTKRIIQRADWTEIEVKA